MRRRCTCPCPTHPPKPGTVHVDAVAFPPLPEPLAGLVYVRTLADGSREAYVEAYEAGRYIRQPHMPTDVPDSWRPAFDWAARQVAEVTA